MLREVKVDVEVRRRGGYSDCIFNREGGLAYASGVRFGWLEEGNENRIRQTLSA